MSEKPVHVHRAKIYNDTNIVLLLIPSLIFVLTLIFLFLTTRVDTTLEVATTNSPSVLGGEKDIDNKP